LNFSSDPFGAIDARIEAYVLRECVGKGNSGAVYRATREEDEIKDTVACKLIPISRLKAGWKTEIKKTVALRNVPGVVQYHGHGMTTINNAKFAYILMDFVDGWSLRTYEQTKPDKITFEFVEALLQQLLEVLLALDETKLEHSDLHDGNIMISKPDPRQLRSELNFKITDFGIGGSINDLKPRDDYFQTALICGGLVARRVDPASLSGEEKYVYGKLTTEFLRKKLPEQDPTVDGSVRNPRKLLGVLEQYHSEFSFQLRREQTTLKSPFDYMNCEQFGDSFELLQKLYSTNFPGYEDLLERSNTILTGPRGCGKTTIFRNLSLKAQLKANKQDLRTLTEYLGIYYHCTDLFFAFPYIGAEKISDDTRKMIVHFFNLSILHELLETLHTAEQNPEGKLSRMSSLEIQEFLHDRLPDCPLAPREAEIIRNALTYVEGERYRVKRWTESGGTLPKGLLPLDFILDLSRKLQEIVPWMRKLPLYFFLDDYSAPKIPESMQRTLNDIIFNRYSECFFKVATESVTSFWPYDSKQKLLEENREYQLVDLGVYFIEAEQEIRKQFLGEVINNRLNNAEGVPRTHPSISKVLGETDYNFNELAERIRQGRAYYHGWSAIADLCSGDIAHVLNVVSDILTDSNYSFDKNLEGIPIDSRTQDKAIRTNASQFLNSIQSAPRTGAILRRIAESFGHVAGWYLKIRNSKNEDALPPMQAFRLEFQDNPQFEGKTADLKHIYDDLIKYAVFISIVRGKSQRGAAVPRLYLRRLLLPTFLLTPSKRDSVRVVSREFFQLLTDPEKFEVDMKNKNPPDSVPFTGPMPKEQTRLDA
jgi:serine/threonine protein kinase